MGQEDGPRTLGCYVTGGLRRTLRFWHRLRIVAMGARLPQADVIRACLLLGLETAERSPALLARTAERTKGP